MIGHKSFHMIDKFKNKMRGKDKVALAVELSIYMTIIFKQNYWYISSGERLRDHWSSGII